MPNKDNSGWVSIAGVILYWIIYQTITYFTPPAAPFSTINISSLQINLIRISISLIMLLTWILGIQGAQNLKKFSRKITDESQSNAFAKTSLGLRTIVYGSMAATLLSSIRNFNATNQTFYMFATIFVNYLYVYPTLFGLYNFYLSAKTLAKSVNHSRISSSKIILGIFIASVASSLYSWFVYTNPLRQFPNSPQLTATYYLSDPLIFLTVIIPLFFTWLLGIFSILYTLEFRRYVSGSVYRTATSELTLGKVLIVFSSVFLQLILSLGPTRLLNQGLFLIIVIIYAFIILQAIAFLLISSGSKKLTTIENVLEKYLTK